MQLTAFAEATLPLVAQCIHQPGVPASRQTAVADPLVREAAAMAVTTCAMCSADIGESGLSCREMFGEVLAREYSDLGYAGVHLLTVDSYALQHPEEHGPRSNAFHLARLCTQLEQGASSRLGSAPDRRQRRRLDLLYRQLPQLEAPSARGEITVSTVLAARSAKEHTERVHSWAWSVWRAWSAQHVWARAETVRWSAA